MTGKGIDVSKHQKLITWDKVKAAGVEFAIIRAGYGRDTVDPYFVRNVEACIRLGIPFGTYWFIYGINEEESAQNADMFHQTIAPYKDKITMKAWCDLEYDTDRNAIKRGVILNKDLRTRMVIAFCERMKSYGYEVGNYANPDYLKTKFGDLSQYPLWLAKYSSEKGDYDCYMWQYSSKGSVDGINGNVDMNILYGDKEEEDTMRIIKPVDYKQNDALWGGLPYAVDGETSTIKSAGCGPTALADVLASLVSPYIDPITLAAWARYHNYKVKNSGTSYSFFEPCAAAYGVTVRRINTANIYGQPSCDYHEQMREELQKGNWLIACMGKGLWTSSGHYVVAFGYDNEMVFINDPASTKQNRACNSWDVFKSQVKYYWVVEVPEQFRRNGCVKDGAYNQTDFVREVQYCTGATSDGKAGPETLSKTVTVSAKVNHKHYVVIPLMKKLKKLGFYTGKVDKIAGKLFTAAVNKYQEMVLNYSEAKQDGEITAKRTMWKSLLGLLK